MKKSLVIILVVLFVFALIRITTSTYENKERGNNVQVLPMHEYSILTNFLVHS